MTQRILITGAGSGLGRALALYFSAKGYRAACTDRDVAGAEETLRLLTAAGGKGLAFPLDVTSEESFRAAAERLKAEWGGVDVVVNNAGVATAGTVAEAPLEQWNWVLNINLLGCVRGCKVFAPLLTAQKSGHIVNVASFAGIANPPAMASYNVAKAGVISLSESLRYEMAPHGVGVSVVCPEFFKTNLLKTSEGAPGMADAAPQMNKIVHKLMERATVTAEDVAADIFDAVQKKRFLVITHPDARKRYHIKRVAPEYYFRKALVMTSKFLQRSS